MKREVQIKLKAVSADHCNIQYDKEKGWAISERGKEKLSSNGTFVFMKSHKQMSDHEPSDLIPLHDGMVISFINYEIRVNLEKKDVEEIAKEEQKIRMMAEEFSKTASFAGTFKAQAEPAIEAPVQDPTPADEGAAVDSAPQVEMAAAEEAKGEIPPAEHDSAGEGAPEEKKSDAAPEEAPKDDQPAEAEKPAEE